MLILLWGHEADDTDLARQQRKLQYLDALHQRLTEVKEQDARVFAKAMLQVFPYMVSDCTVGQLVQWARTVATYQPGDTLVIEGEAKNGVEHMEFYADEQALTELILGVLYQKEK